MRKFYYCLLLAVAVACKNPVHANHSKIEQLADRTCKAIDYRKQRFTCADQIRFAQDTLAQAKSTTDKERLQKRLQVLLKQKEVLLKESLSMADTIRLQLDSLMPYTDKQAQKIFTDSLNILLSKKGCKDESK